MEDAKERKIDSGQVRGKTQEFQTGFWLLVAALLNESLQDRRTTGLVDY